MSFAQTHNQSAGNTQLASQVGNQQSAKLVQELRKVYQFVQEQHSAYQHSEHSNAPEARDLARVQASADAAHNLALKAQSETLSAGEQAQMSAHLKTISSTLQSYAGGARPTMNDALQSGAKKLTTGSTFLGKFSPRPGIDHRAANQLPSVNGPAFKALPSYLEKAKTGRLTEDHVAEIQSNMSSYTNYLDTAQSLTQRYRQSLAYGSKVPESIAYMEKQLAEAKARAGNVTDTRSASVFLGSMTAAGQSTQAVVRGVATPANGIHRTLTDYFRGEPGEGPNTVPPPAPKAVEPDPEEDEDLEPYYDNENNKTGFKPRDPKHPTLRQRLARKASNGLHAAGLGLGLAAGVAGLATGNPVAGVLGAGLMLRHGGTLASRIFHRGGGAGKSAARVWGSLKSIGSSRFNPSSIDENSSEKEESREKVKFHERVIELLEKIAGKKPSSLTSEEKPDKGSMLGNIVKALLGGLGLLGLGKLLSKTLGKVPLIGAALRALGSVMGGIGGALGSIATRIGLPAAASAAGSALGKGASSLGSAAASTAGIGLAGVASIGGYLGGLIAGEFGQQKPEDMAISPTTSSIWNKVDGWTGGRLKASGQSGVGNKNPDALGKPNKGGKVPLSSAQVAANKAESYRFWLSEGYTPEHASGLVANEAKESSFNPSEINEADTAKNGGPSMGIAQWSPARRAAILAGCGVDIEGKDRYDHLRQLKALSWELNRGGEQKANARLKATKTASEAGYALSRYFERPADDAKFSGATSRGQYAQEISAGLHANYLRQAPNQAPSLSDFMPPPPQAAPVAQPEPQAAAQPLQQLGATSSGLSPDAIPMYVAESGLMAVDLGEWL